MKQAAKAPKKEAAKKPGKDGGAKGAGKGGYTVRVYVTYREGVLDPQGQTILGALHALGFEGVKDVRAGKYFVLDLKAKDREAAHKAATEMCEQLLANPVLESYSISISE